MLVGIGRVTHELRSGKLAVGPTITGRPCIATRTGVLGIDLAGTMSAPAPFGDRSPE